MTWLVSSTDDPRRTDAPATTMQVGRLIAARPASLLGVTQRRGQRRADPGPSFPKCTPQPVSPAPSNTTTSSHWRATSEAASAAARFSGLTPIGSAFVECDENLSGAIGKSDGSAAGRAVAGLTRRRVIRDNGNPFEAAAPSTAKSNAVRAFAGFQYGFDPGPATPQECMVLVFGAPTGIGLEDFDGLADLMSGP
jgi:hypothetical protein